MSTAGPAPERLSRERILDAAMKLARTDGIGALSMRRIAAELGTGAMSLYNHVPDKQALMDGLVERLLAEVELPEEKDPRDVCEAWARSLRTTLLDNGSLVPLLFSNRSGGLTAIGRELAVSLIAGGVATDDAQLLARVLGRYVAGTIMLDAGSLRRGGRPEALDDTFEAGLQAMLDGLASHLVVAPPG